MAGSEGATASIHESMILVFANGKTQILTHENKNGP
jgi:hypothetical protein